MINLKSMLILTVIAVLLGLVLWVNFDNSRQELQTSTLLLPTLGEKIETTKFIEINSKQDKIRLNENQGQWVVANKDGYNADPSAIRQLLYGLIGLEIVDKKTSNPQLLPKIGLADSSVEAINVILKTNQQDTIANVIFGNSTRSASGSGDVWFVRHNDDNQAWQVSGELSVYAQSLQWLEKSILAQNSDEISKIMVDTINGKSLEFNYDDEKKLFVLNDLLEGEAVEQFEIDQFVEEISQLRLDDVKKVSESEPSKNIKKIIITTKNKFDITILILDENQGWIELKAQSQQDETKEQTQALNEKWSGWQYQLPSNKISQLLIERSSFIQEKEPDQASSQPDAEQSFINDQLIPHIPPFIPTD